MDTTNGHVWFKYLSTAYVQVGEFEVEKTWLDGKHQLQGVKNVTGKDETLDAQPMPETWSQEWATLTGQVPYDVGSYGIGTPLNTATITVPKVQRFHLLYLYLVSGSKETRMLVQVPTSTNSSTAKDDLGDSGLQLMHDATGTPGLSARLFTTDEYAKHFGVEGFNKYGVLYPQGMTPSRVDELRSFTGEFTRIDGNTDTYHVYFEPTYLGNALPLFDAVYLHSDLTDIDSNVAGVPSQIIRWRGGIQSENIAPINRTGDGIMRDGYLYDVATQTINDPRVPQTITIDGVAYDLPDAYNLGYKRF